MGCRKNEPSGPRLKGATTRWPAGNGRRLNSPPSRSPECSEVTVLPKHDSWLSAAEFSPDGKRVLTASQDKDAHIWDAETGVRLVVLEGHDKEICPATFSPDGSLVVTTSGDNRLHGADQDISGAHGRAGCS